MRLQPRAWARRMDVSRSALSNPFLARNWVVHCSSRPMVQGASLMGSLLRRAADVSPPVVSGPAGLRPPLAQALLLVEVAQGSDHFLQLAGDDGIEPVQVQVDAVVGDAVLREVVGADPLAPVARTDQRAA